MTENGRTLPQPTRIFWLSLNLAFGIAPSLLFFAWVERGTALPWLPLQLDWPWMRLPTDWLPLKAAWDFLLILAFGALHSLFAQPFAQRALERLVPAQAVRSVYMAITGSSLLAVMGSWQHTGAVLWSLPLGWKALNLLSLSLFWGWIAVSGRMMSRFDALTFVGLRQLYRPASELGRTEGMEKLCDTGIYGSVRHPIYLFTCLAFLCAPLMTLDRAIVCAASLAYLAVGIPIEERKLVRIFGAAYEDYRRRVPALVPRLGLRRGG